jgi:hypothetical protein
MSKGLYVSSFLILAFLFVPVVFYFLLGYLVSPMCYCLFSAFEQSDVRVLKLVYLTVYAGLFVAVAFSTYRLSMQPLLYSRRIAFQVACLLVLICCSFLRVIEEGDGLIEWYQSGTYNFWTACLRYPHSP